MHWLLLLSAVALFALACLTSHSGLLGGSLLLSLLAALGWSRGLSLAQANRPLPGLVDPDEPNRPGHRRPGEEA